MVCRLKIVVASCLWRCITTYQYADTDQLTCRGEARAAIIDSKIYMIAYDAPRLYYFEKLVDDARVLMTAATL